MSTDENVDENTTLDASLTLRLDDDAGSVAIVGMGRVVAVGLVIVDGLLVGVHVRNATMVSNLVERSGDGVEKTAQRLVMRRRTKKSSGGTYVEMIAKMKVPQGRLQESSFAALAPVKAASESRPPLRP